MNTITLTSEQMASLKSGQPITIYPPKKIWEPTSGSFYFTARGVFYIDESLNPFNITFGATRQSYELAQRAFNQVRFYSRMLAYRDEFCPEYELEWDNSRDKAYIFYDHSIKKFCYSTNTVCEIAGGIYFPISAAAALVKKLNSGEVVF
jgi:hypothetical protein